MLSRSFPRLALPFFKVHFSRLQKPPPSVYVGSDQRRNTAVTHPQIWLRSFLPGIIPFSSCLLFILAAVAASAQPDEKPAPPTKFEPSIDLSLGVYGQQTYARTVSSTDVFALSGTRLTQVTQETSPSAGVLATFHQSFRPWLGYNINIGYSRFSENYSNGMEFIPNSTSKLPPSSSFIKGSLDTNMYEVTVASVIEGPRTRRFSTFAQVGGGGLFFKPLYNKIGASEETRPASLFGVGANFKLTGRLDLRAEYRGLFYKSPDFNVQDITPGVTGTNQFPMTRLFTVTSTPAVSLVYHFGHAASTGKPARRP
jgi:opacity protein-like surface antigen